MDMQFRDNLNLQIQERSSVRCRTYFSLQHIQSAALFTRKAYEMEQNYGGVFCNDYFSEHRSYVTNAVLSSVFFLEATINELFANSADLKQSEDQIFSSTKELMAIMWELEVPRTANFKILQKYQIALALAKKDLFARGSQPYQDVDLIVKLRNSLVHYEPEWIKSPAGDDFEAADMHTFEKKLKGKFSVNPLAGENNPYYPDKCLGHGCAEWSVNSCSKFTDNFFSRMGLSVPYNDIRARL